MVFHQKGATGGCLIENASKVEQRGSESDSTDCEHAQEAEFDGQNLICTSNFHRDPHRELLVFVLRRLFILLD